MNPNLKLVVQLQELDRRIGELTREAAQLPLYISEIEKKLESHKAQLASDRASLQENEKSRRLLEQQVSDNEQKTSRLREQMNQAKTNEQYHAFQHEINYHVEEVRKIEDRILDEMSVAEALAVKVAAAAEALGIEESKVEQEAALKRAQVADDEKEIAEKQARRDDTAKEIAPDVLALYERVRKSRGGLAVAHADKERCLECNVVLRPQFSHEMRSGDQVMTCESCGRILCYVSPDETPLEDPAGEANPAPG